MKNESKNKRKKRKKRKNTHKPIHKQLGGLTLMRKLRELHRMQYTNCAVDGVKVFSK